MLREEPQPLYNGKVPRRVAPSVSTAEIVGPAIVEADADTDKLSRRGHSAQPAAERPEEAPPEEMAPLPHRFCCARSLRLAILFSKVTTR